MSNKGTDAEMVTKLIKFALILSFINATLIGQHCSSRPALSLSLTIPKRWMCNACLYGSF